MDHKVSARLCGLGVAGSSLVESIGVGKQKVQDTVQEVEELPVSARSPVVPGHLSHVSLPVVTAPEWAAHGVASRGPPMRGPLAACCELFLCCGLAFQPDGWFRAFGSFSSET